MMMNKKGGQCDRFSFCDKRGGGVSPKYAGGGLPFAMLAFPKKCQKTHSKNSCELSTFLRFLCVFFALRLRCLLAGLFFEDKTYPKIRTCFMVLLWCYFEKI